MDDFFPVNRNTGTSMLESFLEVSYTEINPTENILVAPGGSAAHMRRVDNVNILMCEFYENYTSSVLTLGHGEGLWIVYKLKDEYETTPTQVSTSCGLMMLTSPLQGFIMDDVTTNDTRAVLVILQNTTCDFYALVNKYDPDLQ